MAVASGVPILVLVSMGPVAGLVGSVSVLVWTVSAAAGLVMALAFAELAGAFPYQTGGVGVLAARVWAPRSRVLALLSQWGYWFGWSPALAINGILVGTYLHELLLPDAADWTVVAFAAAVLAASVTVNHFGMRAGARLQVVLAGAALSAVTLLVATALLGGRVDPDNVLPLVPPDGWGSSAGLSAVAGALFIAGWSAYGSELALSYGTEYRGGVPDAIRTLVAVAAISVVAYCVLPLVFIGVVGVERVQDDPAIALAPLINGSGGATTELAVGLLLVALVLGLNMVTISSSRSLYQMSRNGDAWTFLGQLNRHGVPGNALKFDLAVNATLLLVLMAINSGRPADLPIALLAAANVGYFTSMSLALVAAWLNHHRPVTGLRTFRIRPGLMRACLWLAAGNVVLIALAGFAWGWANVAAGVAALTAAVVLVTRGRARADAHTGLRPQATCMGWGTGPRTEHTPGHPHPPRDEREATLR